MFRFPGVFSQKIQLKGEKAPSAVGEEKRFCSIVHENYMQTREMLGLFYDFRSFSRVLCFQLRDNPLVRLLYWWLQGEHGSQHEVKSFLDES